MDCGGSAAAFLYPRKSGSVAAAVQRRSRVRGNALDLAQEMLARGALARSSPFRVEVKGGGFGLRRLNATALLYLCSSGCVAAALRSRSRVRGHALDRAQEMLACRALA